MMQKQIYFKMEHANLLLPTVLIVRCELWLFKACVLYPFLYTLRKKKCTKLFHSLRVVPLKKHTFCTFYMYYGPIMYLACALYTHFKLKDTY